MQIQLTKDPNYLEKLYNEYAKPILNLLYRVVLDESIAQDLLHDLFLKLPTKLQSFKGNSSVSTWLYRIAHNEALQYLRQTKNQARLLDTNEIWIHDQQFSASASADSSPMDQLHFALKQTDPQTRALLWLKYGQGLSFEELSAITGEPIGTLKSKLSRAKTQIQSNITNEVAL
jgi:RNA polymerase sigma-70 factor, ECF subfamily